MVRTYEELLAAQTELAHFNPNHDKLGRFTKNKGISSKKAIKGPPASLVGAVSAAGMALAADNLLKEYGSSKASKSALEKIARVGGAATAGAIAFIAAQTVADVRRASKNSASSNHKLSLKDIDDQELIDLNMDDPSFRKEYNVTKAEYDDWKRRQK